MTTEDSAEVTEPTEPTEPTNPDSPRDIGTLLALGTYQGMTDEEIEKVIDYKVELARMDVQSNAYRAAAQSASEVIDVTCANMVESTNSVMDRILKSTTSYTEPELKTLEF